MHIARCLGCRVLGLSTCRRGGLCSPLMRARFSRAKFLRVVGKGKQMDLLLGTGPLFVNPGVCPPGQHLDSHEEGASSQLSASIPPGGALSLAGLCPLGRETALATVTTLPFSKKKGFFFTFGLFKVAKLCFFSRVWFVIFV